MQVPIGYRLGRSTPGLPADKKNPCPVVVAYPGKGKAIRPEALTILSADLDEFNPTVLRFVNS
jgi:hypothetical protein